MIVAQVFLEAMEGCHLFLSPFFVMQTRVFRVNPSTIVQIFVSPGSKDGLPLISSSGVGSPSRLSSSVSFHSFRRAQRCSFSSSSQPELLFLAGFLRSFGSCPFSHGSQALFSVLGTFVGHFDSCPLRSAARRSSRCSLVSLDRSTTFRLQSPARRSFLCWMVSLDPPKAARLRWAARRSSLCSLVSLPRLTAARLRSSARSRSSPCSLVSLARFWRSAHNSCCLAAASSRARIYWALFSRLKGSASNPFSDDIFASNTSLSFDIFFWTQNLVKWRSFPATFARLQKIRAKTAASRWRQGYVRDKQTEKLRESSPLLATCGERTRRSWRCAPSSSRRPVFRIFPLWRGGKIIYQFKSQTFRRCHVVGLLKIIFSIHAQKTLLGKRHF